jgi:Trk-type K+ transport system membrane component
MALDLKKTLRMSSLMQDPEVWIVLTSVVIGIVCVLLIVVIWRFVETLYEPPSCSCFNKKPR